jgi:hypothetical protein
LNKGVILKLNVESKLQDCCSLLIEDCVEEIHPLLANVLVHLEVDFQDSSNFEKLKANWISFYPRIH